VLNTPKAYTRMALAVAMAAPICGCSDNSPNTTTAAISEDGVDLPLRRADADQRSAFRTGDSLFGTPFRAVDGLGPLYIRDNCESCHQEGGRGPGNVQKVAWLQADGVTPGAAMPYDNSLRPYSADAHVSPLVAPTDRPTPDQQLKLTTRMPAAVLGRGYLEAIDDAEIVRMESEQAVRSDAIHGRINRVVYRSTESADPQFHQFVLGQTNLIGRFGLKARQPTLDDFTADALAGDMGITSPQRPNEPKNPAGVTDDAKPGQDVTVDVVRKISTYVRLTEIPARDPAPDTPQARALFDQALCSACHTPSLRTRSDYPIAQLAGIAAPVFTDMLLHAMGTDLADGVLDESARSDEWRTAPLVGLRFQRSYLHDGRATDIANAILMHDGPGSQASESVARFAALGDAEQAALVAFVSSL
jgi:CxxC motif-containing protein (DUF1111 family)